MRTWVSECFQAGSGLYTWQWKNFENRLIFGKVKAYKICANFWATLYMICEGLSAILELANILI